MEKGGGDGEGERGEKGEGERRRERGEESGGTYFIDEAHGLGLDVRVSD